MSVRFFCDLCTCEVKGKTRSSQPVVEALLVPKPGMLGEIKKVGVRIIRSINGTWNGGVICGKCMAAALRRVADELESEQKEAELVAEGA